MVLEKTLESPLDCKEIQSVHSEDQSWDFFGRNDAKAETAVLWPPNAKSWLIGKDSDAGRDWGQEEIGTIEDEMAGGITDSMDMSLNEHLLDTSFPSFYFQHTHTHTYVCIYIFTI